MLILFLLFFSLIFTQEFYCNIEMCKKNINTSCYEVDDGDIEYLCNL